MENNKQEVIEQFIKDEVLILKKIEERGSIINTLCWYRNIEITVIIVCLAAIMVTIFTNYLDVWVMEKFGATKDDIILVVYSYTMLLYLLLELTMHIKHKKYLLLNSEIADILAKYRVMLFK